MKLLIRGGSIAAGHGVTRSYSDILKEFLWAGYLNDHGLANRELVLRDTRYPNERGHEVIAEAMKVWFDDIRC